MSSSTCEFCRFAIEHPQAEAQMLCRRFPPTPVLVNISRNESGAITGTEQLSLFPSMMKAAWCGEFGLRLENMN